MNLSETTEVLYFNYDVSQQVALQRPPQYASGCLFILSEVLKAKPPLWYATSSHNHTFH